MQGCSTLKGKAFDTRLTSLGVVALLVLAALLLGVALQTLAVDDAYITFRYARNLAEGRGFSYNDGQPVLSTTAPLYALILSAGALVWPDLPAVANALSAAAIGVGAILLFALGRREGTPWVGALAGMLYVLYPLLWLSLGLETGLFLALALGAILSYRSDRLYLTAILLALATLTRGDGLILAGALGLHWMAGWMRKRGWARSSPSGDGGQELGTMLAAAAVFVVVLVPLLVWLTWRFGSPLPATLASKRAQSELGVTGFYAHTTYLQGVGVLARARLEQSPLYALFVPAVFAGVIAAWRRVDWVLLVAAWSTAHLVAYSVLGVTPYYWYYAPVAVGLVCLAAAGVVQGARWLGSWIAPQARLLVPALGGLWTLGLGLAFVGSDWAMVNALDGPVPPPEDPVSKVLPEAKTGVYAQAGTWLAGQTADDAVVGVTEVGIMGYYSERSMVDFLGLLQAGVADALARGDLYWALLRYQPDYLVLTAISPLYAYDLRADPWFQAAYAPVHSFEDPRFWGSPLTVYQRQIPRTVLAGAQSGALPAGAMRLDVDFDSIRLVGAKTGETSAQPGDALQVTLYWEALSAVDLDYTVFVHLLGEYDRVIAQRDVVPGLGARPTTAWRPGEIVVDPHWLALPKAAYFPDEAVWEVGLYNGQTGARLVAGDGTDNVRFGVVAVLPRSEPLALDFGRVALTGYQLDHLALEPGEPLQVRLDWSGEGPVAVTVQLVYERGDVSAEATGDAATPSYRLALPAEAPAGAYDVRILLTDPETEAVLPLLGADGQPQGDSLQLTKVRLYR